MDNLEFHVLFNIPQAVCEIVNELVYANEDIVKPHMIRPHHEKEKEILEQLQYDEEDCILHIIDLNKKCGLFVVLINDEQGVQLYSMKITIKKGEINHETTH